MTKHFTWVVRVVSQLVVVATAIVALGGFGNRIITGWFKEVVAGHVNEMYDMTPQVKIVSVPIVVHTKGQTSPGWANKHKFLVSEVPDPEQHYVLDIVDCPRGYTPAVGWHETTGSYPSRDVMYTIDIDIAAGSTVTLRARAREQKNGYAYVDVIVLCRLMPR